MDTDAVVFLAAVAAEDKGQEYPFTVPGNELLALERNVTLGLGFRG